MGQGFGLGWCRRGARASWLLWRSVRWPVLHGRLPSAQGFRRLLEALRLRRRPAPLPPLPPPVLAPAAALPLPAAACPPEPEPVLPGAASYAIPPHVDPYQRWLAHNAWNESARAAARHKLSILPRQPLVAVVMPVSDGDRARLGVAIASVTGQIYPNWELCVGADGRAAPETRTSLRHAASQDPRIRVTYPDGDSNPTANEAARLAQGEFLVFLDPGDRLAPDCLLELVRAFLEDPATDVVYSDDDRMDAAGRRSAPRFKPDWSPELLLSCPYLGGALAVRRRLFESLGRFRAGFEGCLEYDLALRTTEKARKVVHVSRVLYHRGYPSAAAEPDAFPRGARAVQEALLRRGVPGRVSGSPRGAPGNPMAFAIDFPDSGPPVTVIIPTRNRVALLRPCVLSVLEKTTYQNFNVLIIDNDSDDPETLAFLGSLPDRCRVLRLSCPGGQFSYAWLNNEAARHADGEYVLFLNNDTEVRNPEWLSQMVGYARFEGVGPVGARLLFGDGRVQHAGVMTEMHGGMAGHAFRMLPGEEGGYLGYALVGRNCNAVTAACLLLRRDLFLEIGGFDEERFAVAYNDVDLCLRLRDRGYRTVYAPRAELSHYEGASRGPGDNPLEGFAYHKAWGKTRDPYFNPNLSPHNEFFQINTRLAHLDVPPDAPAVQALFCTPNLNLEGPALWQYRLAVALKERGRVLPQVFAAADGPLARLYRAEKVPLHVVPEWGDRLANPELSFPQALQEFCDWVRRQGCDVVHANTLAAFWAVHAAAFCALPSIWSLHERVNWRDYFERFGRHLVHPALEAFTLPYRITCSSEAVRYDYPELNTHDNFSVFRNGVCRAAIDRFRREHSVGSARARLGCPPDRKVISIIGTTCARKGQHDFVRAALELLRRGRRDVFFYLVGCRPGDYLEYLRRLIGEDRGHFGMVPETDDVFPYYRASDVLACCSSTEGFPAVTLEAFAFGVPLVTTTVLGIREQIQPNFSALTYNPGDVAQLTEHLQRLLMEPETRERLAANGELAFHHLPSFAETTGNHERVLLEAYHANRPPAAARAGLGLRLSA